MLYALGLGDKVVGTCVWFNEVLPEFKEINARIPRLADNHPGFEALAAKKPELVTTQFEVHVGPQGVVGTRQQFNELGINVYAMPADCVGKDNLAGVDGSRKVPFSIDTVYRAVDELSTIFDVQEQGDNLQEQLRSRVSAAADKAESLGNKNVSAVLWFSSADIDLDPFVAGQKGIPGFILNTLGVKNVVESDEEYPSVGWETIATEEGFYGIMSTPHYDMGMVMIVRVGETPTSEMKLPDDVRPGAVKRIAQITERNP